MNRNINGLEEMNCQPLLPADICTVSLSCKLATFCRNRFESVAKSLTDGLIIAFVARIEADTLTIYQMLNIRVWARKKRWKWRSDPGKGFVQIWLAKCERRFCTDLSQVQQYRFVSEAQLYILILNSKEKNCLWIRCTNIEIKIVMEIKMCRHINEVQKYRYTFIL